MYYRQSVSTLGGRTYHLRRILELGTQLHRAAGPRWIAPLASGIRVRVRDPGKTRCTVREPLSVNRIACYLPRNSSVQHGRPRESFLRCAQWAEAIGTLWLRVFDGEQCRRYPHIVNDPCLVANRKPTPWQARRHDGPNPRHLVGRPHQSRFH